MYEEKYKNKEQNHINFNAPSNKIKHFKNISCMDKNRMQWKEMFWEPQESLNIKFTGRGTRHV